MNNLIEYDTIAPLPEQLEAKLSRLDAASLALHQALREAAQAARAIYSGAEASHLHIEATISGRPDSDLSLTYGVGAHAGVVQGHSLAPTVREYMRREGWNKANLPLALSNTSKEVPF